mmetsp:Transcript_4382/g.14863  ORF Transcript_4382/g.14863 Transcript_4382/m.14863 type:complete len:343 (-) Transcript_4382:267-1295(-)
MGNVYQKVSAHYGDIFNLHLVYCDEGGFACTARTQKMLAMDSTRMHEVRQHRQARMLSELGNETNATNTTNSSSANASTTTATVTTSTATTTENTRRLLYTGKFQALFAQDPTELHSAWLANPNAVRNIFEESISNVSAVKKEYVFVTGVKTVAIGEERLTEPPVRRLARKVHLRRLAGGNVAMEISYVIEIPEAEATALGITTEHLVSSIESKGAGGIMAALANSDPKLGLNKLTNSVLAVVVFDAKVEDTTEVFTTEVSTTEVFTTTTWKGTGPGTAFGVWVAVLGSILLCIFGGYFAIACTTRRCREPKPELLVQGNVDVQGATEEQTGEAVINVVVWV